MEPTTSSKHHSLVWEYFQKLPTGSRSRLEARDRKTEILDLVSKHETEGKKFSISSRSMRLTGRNSRSRLEAWDWKEEILDLVSRVEKCISLCSGTRLQLTSLLPPPHITESKSLVQFNWEITEWPRFSNFNGVTLIAPSSGRSTWLHLVAGLCSTGAGTTLAPLAATIPGAATPPPNEDRTTSSTSRTPLTPPINSSALISR